MKITFAKIITPSQGAVAFGVTSNGKLGSAAAKLDKRTGGSLSRAMKAASFKGKRGGVLEMPSPSGTRLSKVVLVGLGDAKSLDCASAERIGAALYTILTKESVAAVI
jgi:leucyl aminopeptidase